MTEQRFSGKISEKYSLYGMGSPHHDEFEEKIAEIVGEFSKKINDEKIRLIELGCGDGSTTICLVNADQRIAVDTIENEPSMVEQAKHNLKEFIEKGKVKIIYADVVEYLQKLENSSVDIIASGLVIHNLTGVHRTELMNEVSRVLKSGGLFVNGDKIAQSDYEKHQEDLWNQIQAYDLYLKHGLPELRKEWILHCIEDEKEDRIMYDDVEVERVKDLGFKDVKIIFRHWMDAIIFGIKR
jgi:Methylase involved in ubiquinone/menaquinone biosynthesis